MKIIAIGLLGAVALSGLTACNAPSQPQDRVIVEEKIVHDRPPPPQHEDMSPAPGPSDRYAWNPGFWDHDNNGFRWSGGRWAPRPPNRNWVPARWEQTPNGYRLVPGHWQ